MENIIQMPTNTKLRDEVQNSLLESLKLRGLDRQPWLDLVEQYMNLWDTSWLLNANIQAYGVIVTAPNGATRKNESIGLLVNVNKQMNRQLEKLGIEAPSKKVTGGNV